MWTCDNVLHLASVWEETSTLLAFEMWARVNLGYQLQTGYIINFLFTKKAI